jgi:hypothetical protein
LLVCLYVAARPWRLTASCLWFDEIFSVHAARHTWGGLRRFAAADLIHPPLFYALLKLRVAIGGDSLQWLRLFPALTSIAALARTRPALLKATALLLLACWLLCVGALTLVRGEGAYVWCAWGELAASALRDDANNSHAEDESKSLRLEANDAARGRVNVYAFEDLVAYHLWFTLYADARDASASSLSRECRAHWKTLHTSSRATSTA